MWPDQITDWKVISVDSYDNIPGIRGVADKVALPLLARYNHLEGVINAVENTNEILLKEEWKEKLGINRPPVSQIKAGIEDGRFFKELATIKTDIPVPSELDFYAYKFNVDKVIDLADRLGLDKPMDVLLKVAQKEMEIPSVSRPIESLSKW